LVTPRAHGSLLGKTGASFVSPGHTLGFPLLNSYGRPTNKPRR
jgi:hypothetical protein